MKTTAETAEAIIEARDKIVFEASKLRSRGQRIKYYDELLELVVQQRNMIEEQIAAARKKRAHNKALAAKKAMLEPTPS